MAPPLLIGLTVSALLIVSVITDLRSRTIPDTVPVTMTILAVIATLADWHDVSWADLGLGLGLGFAVGALLFYAGAMGGGDAKLCAALGAVCGWSDLLEVLFATALCGGVVSFLAKRRGQDTVAYAPAIAGGYIVTIAIAWTLPPSAGLWDLVTGRGA